MAIQWELFKNNLLLYFDKNVNSKSTDDMLSDVAKTIADEYEIAVKFGGDMNYKNAVVTYNKPGLQTSIEQAFKQGQNASDEKIVPQIFGSNFLNGVIQFWTGAQLTLLIPPPTSVIVVSNTVSNPGTIEPVLNVSNTENKDEFVNNMIDFFKRHLQTLGGTTIALVPTPGAPVPVPFPWFGYE